MQKTLPRGTYAKDKKKAPTEVEIPTQGSDASIVDATPSLAIEVASNDAFDALTDNFNTADCNDGNSNPEDTSSNVDSEDSWYMETPPSDSNYDALKHVATHFLPGSHGACIDISTLPR